MLSRIVVGFGAVCLLSGCGEQGSGLQGKSDSEQPEGSVLTLTISDEAGRRFDVLGQSLGDHKPLAPVVGANQFWFAWAAFNHDAEVFGSDTKVQTEPIVADETGDCDVRCASIRPGGPPKDGIPALTRPKFVSAREASYLDDRSFIVGVFGEEGAKAYPHNVFWYHEIVNDVLDDAAIAVTHCPLTFSSLGYDPTSFTDGKTVELGVSGKLFQSNLVFYDRSDDTYYSQLMGKAVKGAQQGHVPKQVPVFEMTWGAWKTLFPKSLVLSENTGHARDYGRYPYADFDYFTDDDNTWGTPAPDSRYPNKSLVYGLRFGGTSKVYAHEELREWASEQGAEGPYGVINDEIDGRALAIVFDLDAGYVQAFEASGLVMLDPAE